MSRKQYTLAETIQLYTDNLRSSTYHTYPGVVVAFYSGDGTADIQPAVNDVRFDADTQERISEPFPVIPKVKIMYPEGGGCKITWPLNAGDRVTLHAYDLDPTVHAQTGKVEDPQDVRRHGGGYWQAKPEDITVAGAVAVPAGLVITAPSIVLGAGATDFVALASLVATELGKIQTALNSFPPVPSGGGPVTPGSPYTPGSVAATKVQAI